MSRSSVVFYLNGKRKEVHGDGVFQTMAEYLRYELCLTGTKVVCAEGDCGACTVVRAYPRPGAKGIPQFEAVNSCIALVAHMDCSFVVTVEGLKKDGKPTCVQKTMTACHASQCGYCTPGFVMAATWMLERHETVDEKTVRNHLTGNLCRCTGYKPIIEAAVEAAKNRSVEKEESLGARYISKEALLELKKLQKKPVDIVTDSRHFFAPATEAQLKSIRKKHPRSIILGAATDLGVQYNKGKHELQNLISLHLVDKYHEVRVKKNVMRVGARVTLAELRKALAKHAPKLSNVLDLFASPQIKNVATLVGNVANASPIADTPPFLLALDATVEAVSSKGVRKIALDDFFSITGKPRLNLVK